MLAKVAPRAQHAPALDCVAHEFARFLLQFPERAPSRRLRQFISARCGALVPMPLFASWTSHGQSGSDEALVSALRAKISEPDAPNAKSAGVAIAREQDRAVVVVACGDPEVELEPVTRVVADASALQIRGRVLFDTDGVGGYVNVGAHGVRACTRDPAVAAPAFALRCELAPEDDAIWIQLTAAPRGHVLATMVHSLLALRTDAAARVYQPRAAEETERGGTGEHDATGMRKAVFALINLAREQAGLRPLVLAAEQSRITGSLAPAFFAALRKEAAGQQAVDTIALGLMAGWDVDGGIIRNGTITTLSDDTHDAERWTLNALEQPIGRVALMDPDAEVLAFGSIAHAEPAQLSGLALTYSFFAPEPSPNAWAKQVLERLGRVRKARGLGRTRFVTDTPAMKEQLAAIQRGEVAPFDALRNVMIQTSGELRMSVQGFVWETQDFDALEFPPEVLQKGDLTLGAGVTYHRAPGGAWGQYTVLFVVLKPAGEV